MSGSYGGGGGVAIAPEESRLRVRPDSALHRQLFGHLYQQHTAIPDRDLIFARLRRTPAEVEATGVTIKCITEVKTKQKFVLFLIVRDEPVLLEDESPLFPSDTLISQLQMLIG